MTDTTNTINMDNAAVIKQVAAMLKDSNAGMTTQEVLDLIDTKVQAIKDNQESINEDLIDIEVKEQLGEEVAKATTKITKLATERLDMIVEQQGMLGELTLQEQALKLQLKGKDQEYAALEVELKSSQAKVANLNTQNDVLELKATDLTRMGRATGERLDTTRKDLEKANDTVSDLKDNQAKLVKVEVKKFKTKLEDKIAVLEERLDDAAANSERKMGKLLNLIRG